MKKKIATLLMAVLLIGIGISFELGQKPTNKLSREWEIVNEDTAKNDLNRPTVVTPKCTDDELRISQLPKEVKDNELAMKTIRGRCLWIQPRLADLNGDGKAEIALIGMGYGCGSCHANNLFIIDGDEVIFEYEGDDLSFEPKGKGFIIREPNKDPKDPNCCSTESIVSEYIYASGGTELGLRRNEVKFAKMGIYTAKR
ncbi:hypothetical protein HYU90_03040 [Candidatus Collierbacteria bacterium]|nr:hypothetical protein [Candidatus Collierbacteria bacterium]